MYTFKNFVRFDDGGETGYGELIEENDATFKVRRLQGDPFTELKRTDEVLTVNSLLSPIENTPIFMCIGLNYATHAKEAELQVPKCPAVFTKPSDALAGPYEKVEIHPEAQRALDYEGELTVVMGRDAKNVTEEAALDYVLGYTAGNDVSARNFQLPEASGGQFCYAKSFDKFGPIGHKVVSASEIRDPQALRLITKVNGVVKQDTRTEDMIFSVQKIISHLSRGTTLRKGTIIMTGTPSGVGYFRKEFLKDGDVVEVEIEGVARTSNVMKFIT